MEKRKYYALETQDRKAQLVIFGDITSFPWFESDVSAYNLQKEIQSLDVDKIDVHINSYGGEVAEALAITNTLLRHPAEVTTYVDGFACSAATIIFMAGKERIVCPASNFLVHPASIWTAGNADQLRKEADNLDAITEQSVTMYMTGLTKTREELLSLMAEERFLTPQEVLEWGFATKIDDFDEEEENPTQSIRSMVSETLREKPVNINLDAEAVANMIVKSLEQQFKQKEAPKVEPEPAPEPKPVKETVLDRFLNAFK
ncbi:MAG: Clp protease ClpP [Clostridiales bacterium]|nr:Clp protease ClpP [Clostridiales bacterium]